MVNLSDINAYSQRSGVDNRGFAFVADKQGGDEAVNTTLKAWDKLEAYENEIDKAKKELATAKNKLASAQANYDSVRSYVNSALASLNAENDPDGSARASLNAMRDQARSARDSAQSKVNQAQKKLNDLESGRLNFQRDLMQKLGLDTSRLTEPVMIRNTDQDYWKSMRPQNALEEWAQVFHTEFGKRDANGTDILGEKVQGKEAIESFMRYGQWSLNEMLKELGDKIMKAIQRAGAGKGFSMEASD